MILLAVAALRFTCVPELPSDITAHRTFTPTGQVQAALNDTLWWSSSKQRSRLDINYYDGPIRYVSTVTDPSGSGLAHSAQVSANGSCTCKTFPFTSAIENYTYLGHDVVNCTREPNTEVRNIQVRHWLVFAMLPTLARVGYFSEVNSPYPVQIVSPPGTQDFTNFTAGTHPKTTFVPQACCKGFA
jgi:hypothetical protein